jgi:DNA-binding Xre family transcriptional regulator
MLSINIAAVLAAKGINPPIPFLMKLGISRHSAAQLIHNQYSAVQVVHLTKICHALHCTPSDLFAWNDNATYPITETHPLSRLQKQETKSLSGLVRDLSFEQLQQVNNFIQSLHEKP